MLRLSVLIGGSNDRFQTSQGRNVGTRWCLKGCHLVNPISPFEKTRHSPATPVLKIWMSGG